MSSITSSRLATLVRSLAAMLIVMASFGATPGTASTSSGRALLVPIDMLVRAIDAGSGKDVAAAYISAPTIVDEFAPFHWERNGAAGRWFADFSAVAREASLTHVRVVRHAPTYATVAGTRAWLVIPTDYHYRIAGKPQVESAAWTFVLVRRSGNWRIEASTWAKTAGAA